MIDSIGFALFTRLDGGVMQAAMELEDISRKGLFGSCFRQLNVRGKEFTMRGIVDIKYADLPATLNGYFNHVGGIWNIIKNGITYSDYIVLAVEDIKETPVFSVGGLNGGDWLVESTWRLIWGGGS